MDALVGVVRFAEPEFSAVLEHKLNFHGHGPGIWDEQWIPQAAPEDWIIISTDRGKKGGKKKGEKLPRLCVTFGITHVLIGGGLMKQKQFDKVLAILSVWYALLETANAIRGTCYILEPSPSGRGRGVLRQKATPPSDPSASGATADSTQPDVSRRQQELFGPN